MSVYRLADRLHKTPREIRADFTLEELQLFIAYVRQESEAENVP